MSPELVSPPIDTLQKKYILRHCHKLAAGYLSERVDALLLHVNEMLVSQSMNAEDETIQKLYFDALRTLYSKRVNVVQGFLQGYCQYYYQGIKPEGWGSCSELSGASDSLAQTKTECGLDESLLVASLISAGNQKYQPLLSALAEQFQVVVPDNAISVDQQPLSLGNICYAFRDAIQKLEVPFTIRQQIYTLWQHQVLENLESLYQGINSYISDEHGVGLSTSSSDQNVLGEKKRDNLSLDYIPNLIAKLVQDDQDQQRELIVKQQVERVAAIVDEELVHRVANNPLPESLAEAWKALLIGIYLEDGHDSLRWQAALSVTDDLAWSLKPKHDPQERQHLVKMIPLLVRAVRENLEEISWHDIDFDSVFKELEACHMASLRGDAANDMASP